VEVNTELQKSKAIIHPIKPKQRRETLRRRSEETKTGGKTVQKHKNARRQIERAEIEGLKEFGGKQVVPSKAQVRNDTSVPNDESKSYRYLDTKSGS